MDEHAIESFWQSHPCGDNLIDASTGDYDEFFRSYDEFRYHSEHHILRCLDQVAFKDKKVLEIGLGQGADSEQIIRRGGLWSGLELTDESVNRVRARLTLRNLPFEAIKKGTALEIPWSNSCFDLVYSHGVLHHAPQIETAQREIARVLRPSGQLVVMLYAKHSLNYWVAIALIRRLALAGIYFGGFRPQGIAGAHLQSARATGLWSYLRMKNFIHRSTDGPLNPYSKVYTRVAVIKDFPGFELERTHKEFMHAPPLPVHGWPGAGVLGWHLWAHLRRR